MSGDGEVIDSRLLICNGDQPFADEEMMAFRDTPAADDGAAPSRRIRVVVDGEDCGGGEDDWDAIILSMTAKRGNLEESLLSTRMTVWRILPADSQGRRKRAGVTEDKR